MSLAVFPLDLTIVSSDVSLTSFHLYDKNIFTICMTHRTGWLVEASDRLTRCCYRLIRLMSRESAGNTQHGAHKLH